MVSSSTPPDHWKAAGKPSASRATDVARGMSFTRPSVRRICFWTRGPGGTTWKTTGAEQKPPQTPPERVFLPFGVLPKTMQRICLSSSSQSMCRILMPDGRGFAASLFVVPHYGIQLGEGARDVSGWQSFFLWGGAHEIANAARRSAGKSFKSNEQLRRSGNPFQRAGKLLSCVTRKLWFLPRAFARHTLHFLTSLKNLMGFQISTLPPTWHLTEGPLKRTLIFQASIFFQQLILQVPRKKQMPRWRNGRGILLRPPTNLFFGVSVFVLHPGITPLGNDPDWFNITRFYPDMRLNLSCSKPTFRPFGVPFLVYF